MEIAWNINELVVKIHVCDYNTCLINQLINCDWILVSQLVVFQLINTKNNKKTNCAM